MKSTPDLARQLERAEGMANAACVHARATIQPDIKADWQDFSGVYAMFDGPESPLTQTFGLGLFTDVTNAQLDAIELFFRERGSATMHEVSSFAPNSVYALLSERGYSPIEASVVLVRDTRVDEGERSQAIVARTAPASESALWSQLSAEGWSSEFPEFAPFLREIGNIVAHADGATCFIAELEGDPIAAATLHIQNNVALFAGASTVTRARKRGAQAAMLNARLAYAAAHGVDVAMIVTQPGSGSQRNSLRQGFRPVYTRAKWRKDV